MDALSSTSGVSSYSQVNDITEKERAAENSAAANETKKEENEGVVFEKSNEKKKSSTKQLYNKDAVVAKLKADQQSRMESMQNLVKKLLGQQGSKFSIANGTNLASQFRTAAQNADPATIQAAKESISENGYWGVNQTSDRLVSMAIALSGGDPDKADEMMAAIEKGYKQATNAWGEKLPSICQDTMEATRQKMQDWKNGITTAEDYAAQLS